MLHPNQFKINQTWIVFQVNRTPIPTESEGDFDCVVLMDAASCFILSQALWEAGYFDPLENRSFFVKDVNYGSS